MNRALDFFVSAMLWLTRFELAVARYSSSNFAYIRRLRADEINWMTEQTRIRSALPSLTENRSNA